MPDKLIKDGLRTSAKIGGVSEFAELLFVRLLLATCHLGRCPWDPDWIRTHALPNRPRKRLTEIAAALETLRRAHLVARYTAPDGTACLLIPNHGQRLKHAVRSPWPAPPGGAPDADGQIFMAIPGAPPPAPPAPSAGIGKKPKAPGGGVSPPLFSSTSSESESDWLARLRREWPQVDVAAELREAMRKKPRGVERQWFEREWLARCSEKVGPHAKAVATPPPAPEPPGWRVALGQLYPGNTISGDTARPWASVDAKKQAEVLAHLRRQGRAA